MKTSSGKRSGFSGNGLSGTCGTKLTPEPWTPMIGTTSSHNISLFRDAGEIGISTFSSYLKNRRKDKVKRTLLAQDQGQRCSILRKKLPGRSLCGHTDAVN